MRMLSSLAIVAVFVILMWLVGQALGWEVSLWGSLIGSIVLTLVLNMFLGAFRRPRRL